MRYNLCCEFSVLGVGGGRWWNREHRSFRPHTYSSSFRFSLLKLCKNHLWLLPVASSAVPPPAPPDPAEESVFTTHFFFFYSLHPSLGHKSCISPEIIQFSAISTESNLLHIDVHLPRERDFSPRLTGTSAASA